MTKEETEVSLLGLQLSVLSILGAVRITTSCV